MTDTPLPPVKLAFILDGVVQDVLHTDERLAAIFLSEPLIVDVTGEDGESMANVGDDYDEETRVFSRKVT